MKRLIKLLVWWILFLGCVSCQLLQPNKRRPYVEFIYTVNGEQKQFQEDKHGGFGLGQKYWVVFRFDLEGNIMFRTDACFQNINISSDEEVFRDGKKYYYDNLELQDVYFSGVGGHHYETGWFSFHIVDDGDICFEVTFDTDWLNIETGKIKNVAGTLYVYDKFYGRYWAREYRHYIVPQQ